ncbi:MAG: exosortase/archaeosortase family protein [Bacteroidales bacterium]|nr:exosortase/archaeosortase family protein [Bacteroidales bacterium]
MLKFNTEKINGLIKKYNLGSFRDVAIFMGILVLFHFLWRFFIGDLLRVEFILKSSVYLAHEVFIRAQWMLDVLGVNYTGFDQMLIAETVKNNVIYLPEVNGYVSVNLSCSGLKQFYQFAVLMLLYPGPWRHKAWFIPAGLLIIHFVNILRIVAMTYVTIHNAQNWDFWHDNIVRPFFYVVMFLLWVWWNEKFHLKAKKQRQEAGAGNSGS